MRSNRTKSAVAACLIVCPGCAVFPKQDYSGEAERRAVKRTATRILKLDMEKIVREGAQANFVAIKSDTSLFSKRLDSRTFLAQDNRYGQDKALGIFQGSDEQMIGAARSVLKRLGIPAKEMAEFHVMQQYGQDGQLDSETGKPVPGRPQAGARLIRLSREVDGISVFSSQALLGLARDKQIGFMEVHWPEIPAAVLKEAHRLDYIVGCAWRAPEQKGAQPESIEAGVIHSAALGFLMDIYPAIRVIYKSDDPTIGRKLVLYFDRHGELVPFPRQADLPCEPAVDRRGEG